MVEFSYDVIIVGGSTLTNDVQEIEIKDTGSGIVKSAKLILTSTSSGKYITSSPILLQFDKIQITLTDEDSNQYIQIFEVDRVIPVKNASENYVTEVELLGQEHHLQKRDIAIQRFFESATDVTRDAIDFYNDDLGTLQPTVQNHDVFTTGNNELPRFTANTYEFGVSELKVYDAISEVIDALGASVAAGGAGDFFELYFDSNIADTTKINFKAFSSGSKPASPITISDSVSVNEAPTEGGIDAITGTLVKAWGKKGVGTLPQSVQDFAGELEAFLLHPAHITGVTYPTGARVQLDGVHYEANSSTSTTPPGAAWTVRTFADIRGSANGYSEWTEGKADEWESSGSDPSNLNKGTGCWDSNLVIRDGTNFQTWVHVKSTTDLFDVNYKYGASTLGVYRGLRCLVNGTGINGFAGNDSNGRAFSNNIAEYDGTQWIVKYVTVDGWRTAVRNEGQIYERQTGTWTVISGNDQENHCFHIAQSVSNVAGYNSTPDGTGGTYGDNSAVEWHWQYNALDSIIGLLFATDGYYKIGAWANFSLPFPENSHNSNTLGELYGNNTTKKEPATVNISNMELARDGSVGFNHDNARDLGPLEGIQFWTKFQWKDLLGNLALQGNFKMRCALYDTNDNVVIQDFTIPFNDLWEPINLPFSGFEPYRARLPISFGNIAANTFLNDLEILNVFQWKNIKMIGLQWQEVYDEEGRFHPEFTRAWSGVAAGTADIRLAIDGFCFTKPLLAVTAPVTDRVLEPPALQMPDVSNSVQLGQIADSQLELEKFQHQEFITTTQGRCDIEFGDSFFLEDSVLVNRADRNETSAGANDGDANTIKLVAKRIIYKITKRSKTGAGPFLRTIIGIKRFES